MLQKLQEDFKDVSFIHILRSMNGRADVLAKNARTRCYIFFYIDQIRTAEVLPGKLNRLNTTT